MGKYPEDGLRKYAPYLPEITDEDMALISQPLDFMGENIYNGIMLEADENGDPRYVDRAPGFPHTGNNWPVTPECFRWGLKFLYERYKTPIFVTENGMCCRDVLSSDGKVHDPQRIDFLNRYILAMRKAMDEGADIRGYFQWTLTDNFEWNLGFRDRFGLVYVDFVTQRRYRKDSSYWYEEVIRTNGKNLLREDPVTFCEAEVTGCRLEIDAPVEVEGGRKMKVLEGYGTVDALSLVPGDVVQLPGRVLTLDGRMTVVLEEVQ